MAPAAVTEDGIRWTIDPRHRHLFGEGGPALGEWLSSGRAAVVKHGPHRTVYRVELPHGTVYWKHCRLTGLRSWLRECLRPPKARLEHDKALRLAERQVPTIEPLAWGVRDGLLPGESFLLTRELEQAVPLTEFFASGLPTLPAHLRPAMRRQVARGLGCFMARLHDAGVTHPDLHPGNILIELPPNEGPRFYLIDLHAVHLGRPLSWVASRENLAVFNRWFLMRAERSDRLRFWESYRGARAKPPPPVPPSRNGKGGVQDSDALVVPQVPANAHSPPSPFRGGGTGGRGSYARELEARTWASNQRFWRSRDRRCLGTNRYFRRVRSPVADGHAVRDLDEGTLRTLLADPDAPFHQPGVKLLKDSRSSIVAEIEVPTPDGLRAMIYKRFRVTSRSEGWVNLLRRPAALRSWMLGHALRDRGLPTPRPLLVLQRRRWGMRWEGYLLAEKVPDAADLHAALASLASLPDPERRRAVREGIDRVARLVRQTHQRQVAHRDLKAANILFGRDGGEGLGRPWLIDLVGVSLVRRLSRRRRVQNLARLNASFLSAPAITRTDRLRFLRMYLLWALHGKAGWKSWWEEIDAATRAKAARNARNGRPLA